MTRYYGSTVSGAWRAYMDVSTSTSNDALTVTWSSAGMQSINYGINVSYIYHSIGYNKNGESSVKNSSGNSFYSGYGQTVEKSYNTGSKSFTREHSAYNITVYSYVKNTSGFLNGASQANSSTITVPAKPSYTVSYNANGGSGAPSNQTKWYNETLTLSSTTPTRTGYTFLGWNTSSTATTAAYQPGASYTSNSGTTLYAIWSINTYTVSYNANGGSGAPSNQTKTYGVNLTLSSTTPTRTGYTFLGWNTSSTATTAAYSAGGSYTANNDILLYAVWKRTTYTVSYNANGGSGAPANQTKTHGTNLTLSSTKPTKNLYTFKGWSTSVNGSVVYAAGGTYSAEASVTLYAVWELAYVSPSLRINSCYRCDASGNAVDDGDNIYLSFTYTADRTIKNTNVIDKAVVYCKRSTASSWTTIHTYVPNVQTGTQTCILFKSVMGAISQDYQYDVKVTIEDTYGKTLSGAPYSTTQQDYISLAFFTMDFLAGGKGIAFGKPSSREGFDCAMNASFDGTIHGNGKITSDSDIESDTRIRAGSLSTSSTTYAECQAGAGRIVMYSQGATTGSMGVHAYPHSDASTSYKMIEMDQAGVVTASGQRVMHASKNSGSYWGLMNPEKAQSGYLRSTQSGFIPYASGGNSSSLGTSGWPWNNTYTKNLYVNGKKIGEPTVLWSGAWYPGGSQEDFAEAISAQPNGALFVFSYFPNQVANDNTWSYFFVPKWHVDGHLPSGGPGYSQGILFSHIEYTGVHFSKYIYIYDTHMFGHANNYRNGDYGGVTLSNSSYCLRFVLGV